MTDLLPVILCCDYSRQAGEQVFGTAARADVWLALEHNGRWSADAFPESDIPDAVKDKLKADLAAINRSRLQLIRHPESTGQGKIAFFVALVRETTPVLYRFDLDRYEDLLDLDVPSIAAGNPAFARDISDEPLILICANGKRDMACAKYGRAAYDSLVTLVGSAAWHTTHLGGHRFAGTCIFLPHGLTYGRLTEGNAATVVSAFREGKIALDLFRGRANHDDVAQAADYYLRQSTGELETGSHRLQKVRKLNDDEWAVVFESARTGTLYSVEVARTLSDFAIIKNSGETPITPGPQFRLVGVNVEPELPTA